MEFSLITWLTALPLFTLCGFLNIYSRIYNRKFFNFLWMRFSPEMIKNSQYDFHHLSFLRSENVHLVVQILQVIVLVLAVPGIAQWCIGLFIPSGLSMPDRKGKSTSDDVDDLERRLTSKDESMRFVFRVVTRGTNPTLVWQTCVRNIKLLEETIQDSDADHPNFNFIFEVVSDRPLGLNNKIGAILPPETICEIVVPENFSSKKNTLFKARALHYANLNMPGCSQANDNDFIVHLDEETRLHRSSIRGLQRFSMTSPNSIGQGAIFYGKGEIVNPWLTLCDSLRCADDFLRFRPFFANGYAFGGMKGSFFVLKNEIEKSVSFDLGPEGSITEDAVFALKAMQQGINFSFINGHMEEKSPFTYKDFLKQRARWMKGLHLCVHMSEVHLWAKLIMAVCVYCWILCPLTCALTLILAVLSSASQPIYVQVIQTFIWSLVSFVYCFGAMHNFSFHSSGWRYPVYVIICFYATPVFWAMEISAVLYFLYTFSNRGFHIVQKECDNVLDQEDFKSTPATKSDEVESTASSTPSTASSVARIHPKNYAMKKESRNHSLITL